MNGRQRYYAKAARKKDELTKTERSYQNHLISMKSAGLIAEWWREPFNIRLTSGAYYKADFMVQRVDGVLEIHEVKGSVGVIEEKTILKAKLVAENLPFRMIIVWPRTKHSGGGWECRNFTDELQLQLI
jgi:hypothetical protein